jgi:two-component system, NtrC family, response regulator AtoC
MEAPVGLRLYRQGRAPGGLRLDPTETYTVGRAAHVDLCFDDEGVSRVHAHLKLEDGSWVLVDARSANGTFLCAGGADPDAELDGATLAAAFARARPLRPGEPAPLAAGDIVFFGDERSALFAVGEAPPESAVELPALSARGRQLHQELARAARARGPVLLIGASGSGKTWAAQRIHELSGRRGRFIALNAAALPHDPTQLRSVLLGHKRGAFTGATQDLEGAWFAARDGTFFLDEVDSLGELGQAFLLTLVEQTGDLSPLGGAVVPRAVDVRVVTAAKSALAEAGLRRDLAFRLADGAIVEIPRLAERREDIPDLVRQLTDELRREDGASARFSAEALATCAGADWPGEIRQLRGLVRLLAREALLEGRAEVSADDVRARLSVLARALGEPPATTDVAPTRATGGGKNPRALTRADLERALAQVDGNIQRAAALLGVARGTMITKMDHFGIPRPRKR